jgi:rhodanese-related sulfurtransferase
MTNSNLKKAPLWVLLAAMVIGLTVTGGLFGSCFNTTTPTTTTTPAETQIAEDITAEEAFTLIQANQQNPDFVIIDVRTPEEFAQGHLENAANINYNSTDFSDEIKTLDKNRTYLIYCLSGARSSQALGLMAVLQFAEVYSISGGITAWQAAGLPVVE